MIRHLAVVMDGNRRWAKKQGLMAWMGHKKGVDAVKNIVEFSLDKKIEYLTLYTFSLENFSKRSLEEQGYLFDLIIEQASQVAEELIKFGVRIKFIGDRSLFPSKVIPAIDALESSTAQGNSLTVHFLFCYGGKQEILAATQAYARDFAAGIAPQLTQESFKKYLWLGELPDPELIIRTGGVQRLSNFLPYQSAYSELYFTNTFWPDITKDELTQALHNFKERQRNFGA